ncbi:MAG: hypothetical protein EAZ11_12290 [Curvibacter sp.]|nr:MAG: hypothetical protein EAZ11_12290 [Curvibacter sp.]
MAEPLAWIQAGSQLLNAVGAARAAPGAPGISTSGNAPNLFNNDQDFSGFTVATSGARADGAKISKTSSDQAGTLAGMGSMADLSPVTIALFAAGAVVVWKLTR